MNIPWEVEDGYVGGSRPQSTVINSDEVLDLETDQEVLDFVNDYVYEDFKENISPNIRLSDEKIIAMVRAAQKEAQEKNAND